MNRRFRSTTRDLAQAEQKIADLHFEAAQLRLAKEKELIELVTARESEVAQLKAARDFQLHRVARLAAARVRDAEALTRVRQELSAAHERIAFLSKGLEEMSASYSWRLTRPIRALSALFTSRPIGDPTAALSATAIAHAAVPNISSVAFSVAEMPDLTSALSPSPETPNPTSNPVIPLPMELPVDYLSGGKKAWDIYGRNRLTDFLASRARFSFPPNPKPKLTVILVFYNNAHLSLLSLLSIKQNADVNYEVVVVDNCSNDLTDALLDCIDNATVIRNRTNLGFAPACMQGVQQSRGDYVCFLNNDALLEPNSLKAALRNFENDSRIGAVGGRILCADGRLQEAGSILWCDGTSTSYGRGDDPDKLQYSFRRPVDYCSGAFLITPRRLFEEVGGFDEVFAPGYYEDADYCMRLWTKGFRVLYEPLSGIRHYENAGSANKAAALTHVMVNHRTFWQRWRERLHIHYEPREDNLHSASIASADDRLRILLVFDEVPHHRRDASYSRPWEILNHLATIGHVTCATLVTAPSKGDYVDIPRDIQLLDATDSTHAALRRYIDDYDLIWVSGEQYLHDLTSALSGVDCPDFDVVLDVGQSERQVPTALFEEGMPSKQFGSVSQREVVIRQGAAEQLGGGEGNASIKEERTIKIWVVG